MQYSFVILNKKKDLLKIYQNTNCFKELRHYSQSMALFQFLNGDKSFELPIITSLANYFPFAFFLYTVTILYFIFITIGVKYSNFFEKILIRKSTRGAK